MISQNALFIAPHNAAGGLKLRAIEEDTDSVLPAVLSQLPQE